MSLVEPDSIVLSWNTSDSARLGVGARPWSGAAVPIRISICDKTSPVSTHSPGE
ncbi:hypothetical protein [Nocardia sp. CS682]|uniref:hypothetical protein n=1 Tax=Nocardia sp. CS682 TaxID=1047172 RepID=UPI0014308522|nr:hypothetical protein [Nocardia sp. CS682]